jgi:hypothetical protein
MWEIARTERIDFSAGTTSSLRRNWGIAATAVQGSCGRKRLRRERLNIASTEPDQAFISDNKLFCRAHGKSLCVFFFVRKRKEKTFRIKYFSGSIIIENLKFCRSG